MVPAQVADIDNKQLHSVARQYCSIILLASTSMGSHVRTRLLASARRKPVGSPSSTLNML